MTDIFPPWKFRDLSLLRQALTHKSADSAKTKNNERLEWFGDSLLEFLIARELYHRHPHLPEGALTEARVKLVNGATLASLARNIGLNKHIKISRGTPLTDSVMAGVLEAYLAAVYFDGGIEAAEAAAGELFGAKLREIDELVAANKSLKEPKTELQEKTVAYFGTAPEYEVTDRNTSAGNALYYVECRVGETISARGEAPTIRAAEQMAARECLKLLPQKPPKPKKKRRRR